MTNSTKFQTRSPLDTLSAHSLNAGLRSNELVLSLVKEMAIIMSSDCDEVSPRSQSPVSAVLNESYHSSNSAANSHGSSQSQNQTSLNNSDQHYSRSRASSPMPSSVVVNSIHTNSNSNSNSKSKESSSVREISKSVLSANNSNPSVRSGYVTTNSDVLDDNVVNKPSIPFSITSILNRGDPQTKYSKHDHNAHIG